MGEQDSFRPGEQEVITCLRASWDRLTQSFAVKREIGASSFQAVFQAYSDPNRYYHRLPHIQQMLETITTFQEQAKDLALLEWAAWFHDIVYDSRARDNEERSAVAGAQMLTAMQLPIKLIASVQGLILQTKTHQPVANDGDSLIFLDADLAILGAGLDQYKTYADGIRQEYAWVPEAEYRLGRARVLQNFLERPRIFLTDKMFTALEELARANLTREIHALQKTRLPGQRVVTMKTFDPSQYPPLLTELVRDERLAPLGPGSPNRAAQSGLENLTLETAFAPERASDPAMAQACFAGLWLYHDFLDESHAISQEIETPTGSYWHGILHRREPDASNAAYWFRRVGEHPIFETLAKDAQDLGLRPSSDRWNPLDFIDLCEKHRGANNEQEMLLRNVQRREWELLFDWCFRRATGRYAK